MPKTSEKDPLILQETGESHRDYTALYLRLQSPASITCLGLPSFLRKPVAILSQTRTVCPFEHGSFVREMDGNGPNGRDGHAIYPMSIKSIPVHCLIQKGVTA